MIHFRHYRESGSMGNMYGFGINFYKDGLYKRHSLDVIIGKHVFVWFIDKRSNE